MTRRRRIVAFTILAALMMSTCVSCALEYHKAVYQNGVLLGEWDLRSEGPSAALTSDGREVFTSVAHGIPLDTVVVGGGVIVLSTEPRY